MLSEGSKHEYLAVDVCPADRERTSVELRVFLTNDSESRRCL